MGNNGVELDYEESGNPGHVLQTASVDSSTQKAATLGRQHWKGTRVTGTHTAKHHLKHAGNWSLFLYS